MQPHPAHPRSWGTSVCTDAVVAGVDGQPKGRPPPPYPDPAPGLHRPLVGQPDPASLVAAQIEKTALSLADDPIERRAKLLATAGSAASRTRRPYGRSEWTRTNRGTLAFNCAAHECDVLLAVGADS